MKAWGGRFKGTTDPLLERFSASIDVDSALFREDIEGSKAQAAMLEKIGILTGEERVCIMTALEEIKGEIERGELPFSATLEDIHMHVETRLVEKTGDAGRKLHTGRSRNDQVSLDMRMYVKTALDQMEKDLVLLMRACVNKAEKEKGTLMTGYTHLQRAQVVTFAHYLMAYYFMFKRDRERIGQARARCDVMPLGSGALAGSTIPLDREFVREMLGFSRLSENSMDGVADRDFVLDALYCSAMIMTHLSRLAEDLILFSTSEFSYVSLPDSLCTGSSLMPHKKNPDGLELIRGKTGKVIGDLMALFTILKGLPLTYNRDLQEDKEALFHGLTTAGDSLSIMTLCVDGLTVNRERMEAAVRESFATSVEMAEYLTRKGMPFREAHGVAGQLVRFCEDNGKGFMDLSLGELKQASPLFEADVFDYLDPRIILDKRVTAGGASFKEVERQLEAEKLYLSL